MDNLLDVVGRQILERIQQNLFEKDVEALVPVPVGTPPASFTLLRDRCLEQMENNETRLFEDAEFPVEGIRLHFSRGVVVPVRWLRPHQISRRPQFINQHPMAGDVRQGSLGDCWELAAASVLAQYGALFYRVVPPNQGFGENYAAYFIGEGVRQNLWWI
ncbi:hypothetical protein niasHT_025860 [Heterodera trifolii]|uniref:Calpain catalytic domain-containing protein n=1 Tax=Heterodera trifolii TaxID=157864 RepID=A0ABD2KJ35_9BILA